MNHDCIGSLGSIPNEPKRLVALGCWGWGFPFQCAGLFEVDGSSSNLDDLRFLSLPPMYFRPVIHKASCLVLTLNTSCNFLCVMPVPKKFRILNANVAASRRNGLFGFSFFMNLDSGLGTIVILTLSPQSLGTPGGLASWPTCLMNLGNALM